MDHLQMVLVILFLVVSWWILLIIQAIRKQSLQDDDLRNRITEF